MPSDRDPYCHPGTDVLFNKLGITDAGELARFERTMTELRAAAALARIEHRPKLDQAALQEAHRILFGDVYAWAGELRTVEIAKAGTPFAPVHALPTYADNQILPLFERQAAAAKDDAEFAAALAHCWGELNVAHPFREGNGRATQVFVTALARRHGRDIDWSLITREREIEAAKAAFAQDYEPYAALLRDALRTRTSEPHRTPPRRREP